MNIRSLAILRRMHLLVMLFPSLVFAAQPVQTISTVPQWGTYLTPFAADSLWNARPVDPVLGDFVIPKSSYFPSIASGKYSTGMFLSKASDSPMIVKGPPEKNGVWDPDA
ncbi:MAG: Atrophin-1 multi-domain protein, partial [Burkholderiaceae bacterium]